MKCHTGSWESRAWGARGNAGASGAKGTVCLADEGDGRYFPRALKHTALAFLLLAATCLAQEDPPDIKVLERRANGGEAKAQLSLGLIYDEGVGAPKDRKKAAFWLEKAAAQGVPEAQFNIGTMYETGVGVAKSETKAAEWFEKAANQGLIDAQFNLANMYSSGRGVEKSVQKAMEWYEKAANKGMSRAQFNLGLIYTLGQGIPKDATKAYAWFSAAAADGDPAAKTNVEFIESKLDAKQKGQMKKAARELAEKLSRQKPAE